MFEVKRFDLGPSQFYPEMVLQMNTFQLSYDDDWNNLPYDVVNAVSLNSFERKLATVGF